MPEPKNLPTTEASEADVLEQQADADASASVAASSLPDSRDLDAVPLANEADLIEQATPVPGDEDEDYPHGPPDSEGA